jgi:hypothetical protein
MYAKLVAIFIPEYLRGKIFESRAELEAGW